MPGRYLKATFFDERDPVRLGQLAKLAEKCERYEDQCWFVSKLIKMKCRKKGVELTDSESELMLGFKDAIKQVRSARLDCIDELLEDKYSTSLLDKYKREIIEIEIQEKCMQVISLLENYIIPSVKGKSDETEVSALKLTADYYRYLCELDDSKENIDKTLYLYQSGWDIAIANLDECHISRLGLALNFSVFYMDICNDKHKALMITKYAIDTAQLRMNMLDSYEMKRITSNQEISVVLSLLNDQLKRWNDLSSDESPVSRDGKDGISTAAGRESGTR